MINYLKSLEKFGMNLGLERITSILDRLGNPQNTFKSIHIAGTNGKGSTAAMVASILQTAGYRVGLYTSPHFIDYTERIKINGKDIARKKFEEGLMKAREVIEGLMREKAMEGEPTVFEVLTAVAFWYFAKKKVEYAVVEVGLGGRLDATNVITPLVSVITNIDLEHTEILGKTLAKIAGEKAAIIKRGIPVVTAETKTEPLKVIKKVCQANQSQLAIMEPETERLGSIRRRKPRSLFSGFRLRGDHQKLNAACAVAAIRLAGIKVTRSQIKKGLAKTVWPGRLQIISRQPLIILDGAHNPAGAKVLAVALKKLYPKTQFTVIYGCQRTKDFKNCQQNLKPVTARLIQAKSSHPDASPGISLKRALALWDKKTPLLITGSLFLVADFIKIA
ncbi:MAG: folylpolyglutamate synthase/dihydrofolate synthase family protein [Candidatus Margulisiibacteriota bacterium]